ncbi:MAG: hypothetical protein CXT73_04965 [Methanobacteriota archaeon]|nr:MAG: hypothetical protein CXT73_04965 [Euryarchaeota archaeon]
MKTRSGIIYELKCKCGKYFPNLLFHNRCSQCYKIDFPDEWKEHLDETWCSAYSIPQEQLEDFINKHSHQSAANMMKIFKTIVKDNRSIKYCLPDVLNNLKNNIQMRNHHLHPESFFGLTAKQAGELYQVFRDTYKDQFGHGGLGQGSDYKWQHLFAGLIFDTWNINTDVNGPIAYCYYGQFGAKPRGNVRQIPCSPWMKREISNMRGKRQFWLDNMPFDHFKIRLS